jgi:cell division protein FtsZ
MRNMNELKKAFETPQPLPLIRPNIKRVVQYFQNSNQNKQYDNEKFLSDLVRVLKVKSLVVGVGGAGNNTVSRLQELGLQNADTLNVNSDAHDLYYSNANHKLLIGKETCNGLGSGNDPSIGAEAAKEDLKRLRKSLDADIVFLTCGLGGGTGTGAAPIIAREAKKNNALVVTFCSIPFLSEGAQRRNRAKTGLSYLAKYSDTIIPVPNDNILRVIPKAPVLTCFKVMDEVLTRTIREIIKLINNCGLINIDFADVRKVFEKSGEYPSGLIGLTESLGQDQDLINKSRLALHNPLLRPNTKKIKKCIVSVSGDHKLSLSKVNRVLSTITKDIPQDAKLKFGTNMDPELGSKIRIMVLGKGPVSPYVRAAVNSEK